MPPSKYTNLSGHDVDDIHRKSDLNARAESQHHSLGKRPTEASPGNHNHDGTNSTALFTNVVITGSRSANTASVIQQILTALVPLGLQDGTSP